MESDNPFESYWMEGDSLAPPCQAEMDVVDSILDVAGLTSESVLFDLGCGDGRICLRASEKYKCKSLGCEIEERLINDFKASVTSLGLESLVTVVHGDLQELDLSAATHIAIYLLPESIEIIKPKIIDALTRGTVVICNTWGPKDPKVKPLRKVTCGFCNNVTLLIYDQTSLI